MKPVSLKKKITRLELFFFAIFMTFLLLSYFNRPDDPTSPFIGIALFAFSAFQISKFIRFYRLANAIINTLWLIAALLVFSSGILSFYDWQWGVMGLIGIIIFHYTWRNAFLDNRLEIT